MVNSGGWEEGSTSLPEGGLLPAQLRDDLFGPAGRQREADGLGRFLRALHSAAQRDDMILSVDVDGVRARILIGGQLGLDRGHQGRVLHLADGTPGDLL